MTDDLMTDGRRDETTNKQNDRKRHDWLSLSLFLTEFFTVCTPSTVHKDKRKVKINRNRMK